MEAILKSKLNEIVEFIDTYDYRKIGPGVIDGKTGISEFYYYLSKYFDDEKYLEKSFEIIENIVNDINEGYASPTFSVGLAGFGWHLETFVDEKVLIRTDIEFLDDLDEYLYANMIKYISDGYYDYLHGGLGIALYFLKRIHKPNSIKYLEEFIDILNQKGTLFHDGSMAWESQKTIYDQSKGYNLSLSHGLASIIGVLRLFVHEDICKTKVEVMLNRSLQYLLSKQKYIQIPGCYFPDWVELPNHEERQGRMAWCYGDLEKPV